MHHIQLMHCILALVICMALSDQDLAAAVTNCPSAKASPVVAFPEYFINAALSICEESPYMTAGYLVGTSRTSKLEQGGEGSQTHSTLRGTGISFVGGMADGPLRFGLSRLDLEGDLTIDNGLVADDSFEMTKVGSIRAMVETDVYEAFVAGRIGPDFSVAMTMNSLSRYTRVKINDVDRQLNASVFGPEWSIGWRRPEWLMGFTRSSSLVSTDNGGGLSVESQMRIQYQRFMKNLDFATEVVFHNYADLDPTLDDKLSYDFKLGYTDAEGPESLSRYYLALFFEPAYYAELGGADSDSIGSTKLTVGWSRRIDSNLFLDFSLGHRLAAKEKISEDGVSIQVSRAGRTEPLLSMARRI